MSAKQELLPAVAEEEVKASQPAATTTPPASAAAPVRRQRFWDSVEQQDRTEAWVRANPRSPGESWLRYAHRIAVGAGLMQDFTAPQGHALDGSAKPERAREPGEDG